MGKSPGKWIKTLLFGKKATRSHSKRGKTDKKAGNNKGYPVDKEDPTPGNSPVISEPILVSTYNNGVDPEVERGNPSSLGGETTSFVPTASQGTEDQGIPGSVAPTVPEKSREEQAATKAQAVLRGFLARRAFRALKGIIRLQALVRGHLVRRQAIVTLHSMVGIIKLQAHFRGQKVRSSGLGLEVNKKFDYRITVVSQYSDSRKGKLYTNTFVCKLLSSSLVVIPLQIYYDKEEPNSVPNWMERWSISCFWKLPPQPKKTTASKSQAKRGSYAMETESGRPKRNVRKNSPVTVDVGPTKTTSEPDKPKRNVKKFLSSMDSVQDPQSELEKVKRNLRKVSGSLPETSDGPEIATDAQPCSIRKVVDPLSENPEQGAHESEGKTKKDIALTTEVKPDMEIEGTADQLVDNSLPNADKDGNVSVMNGELNVKEEQTCTEMNGELNVKEEQTCTEMNGELNVKEEQTCTENQKTSKRRASFSAKSDYAENGLQNTPTLPSYMQATKSAKAKLRGLNSARFGSDSAEKNEPTRRHSLPSSVNGKVNSYSPRTQKILQTSGKGGGCRSDRSLLSSRDGNEKLIHVGWRR